MSESRTKVLSPSDSPSFVDVSAIAQAMGLPVIVQFSAGLIAHAFPSATSTALPHADVRHLLRYIMRALAEGRGLKLRFDLRESGRITRVELRITRDANGYPLVRAYRRGELD